MEINKKDNRTAEQIFADIDKRGWAFGRRLTPEEHARAVAQVKATNEKINRKEDKAFYKELDNSFKEKSSVLLFLSKVFTKIFHLLGVLWSLAGLANIYFVYQIYKVCQVSGWHGIIETKWSLYIVAYLVILFVLKQAHYRLWKYAND